MNNNEVRTFGYCAECESEITDETETYYCNDEGERFCCIECLLAHYNIDKIEV